MLGKYVVIVVAVVVCIAQLNLGRRNWSQAAWNLWKTMNGRTLLKEGASKRRRSAFVCLALARSSCTGRDDDDDERSLEHTYTLWADQDTLTQQELVYKKHTYTLHT